MSKILVVFTGGTIGSGINNKGNIDADKKAKFLLLDQYNEKHKDACEFDTAEPYYELSENISSLHLNKLISFLNSVDYNSYDGIILTHGSDTLSYTSAMLSFALRYIPIPLILTAANYPLTDERSNGLLNFAAAVSFIKSGFYNKGVFVCYSNLKGEATIFLGSRLLEADHIFDRFKSVDNSYLCKIINEKIIPNDNSLNPTKEEIEKEKAPLNFGELKDNILLLRSYPGQNFENISLNGIKAVLMVGYHSATVCNSTNTSLSFWNFANRCKEKGIDIFISSFKDKNGAVYESLCGEYNRLCNISTEAAYAKLLLAYSSENPKVLIENNLYFESVL